LLLGPTGVYSSARLKTRALALSTNRLNAARRMQIPWRRTRLKSPNGLQ
jgi:hypothetical protein